MQVFVIINRDGIMINADVKWMQRINLQRNMC